MAKRKKRNNKINHKIGAPPGELLYTGGEVLDKVSIQLLQYNESEIIEKGYSDLSQCIKEIKPDYIKWINVNGIHNKEIVETLGKEYNIHPLTLEDIMHVESRPKFEDYNQYVVAVTKMLYFDSHVHCEHLSILLFKDTVVSFQEPHGGDAFDIIRNRLRQGKGRIRKLKADYLAYALIDAVVDCYFSVLEKVGEKIEQLDEEILYHSDRRTLLKIHDLKREMIFLRKQMWPAREMINNLVRSETELIHSGNDFFLRDLQDHIVRVSDSIESYREMLSDIMEVYLSNTSNKMNEAIKALTIISSIFIPVTFIVGVYGMNFENMPETKSDYGYWVVWVVMILIMGGMALFIKKKKWW